MPFDQNVQDFLDAERNAGRLTRPNAALSRLLADPRAFLSKHPIVNTFDCAAHGQKGAYLTNDRADAKRPGSRLGTLNMHTTESFGLTSYNDANLYGHQFQVHGVYTSRSREPQWYTLDLTGPAIMLTAKLTGCTFVARAGAGNTIEVTHMQPHHETGDALNRRMRGHGNKAYGRLKYDYNSRSVNVIGVRRNGRWKIYAQKLVKNGHEPRIVSVKRIWPA